MNLKGDSTTKRSQLFCLTHHSANFEALSEKFGILSSAMAKDHVGTWYQGGKDVGCFRKSTKAKTTTMKNTGTPSDATDCLLNHILPKTNMEPENTPLENEKHLPTTYFLGSILLFRGVGLFYSELIKFKPIDFLPMASSWQWTAFLHSTLQPTNIFNNPPFKTSILRPFNHLNHQLQIWKKNTTTASI